MMTLSLGQQHHRLGLSLTGVGMLVAAVVSLAAVSGVAHAQTGIEVFNGNWVGAEIVAADTNWPAMEVGAVVIAIDGGNRDFEAEWTSLALDEGALEWSASEAEFEPADRPGYFVPEDGEADIFEGETQLWAYFGETGLILGRLQIDADTGLHIVYTCRLTRTEAGLEAELTMSTSDSGVAVATLTMVRK